ncbi:MAG: hypothetical protein JKP98_16180 [Rhodobacteraceae bacterium]|nr:hypothetical protein [Paracoccaceae bacterium]
MTPSEELEFIQQLAPEIAARIDNANAEFEALAAREVAGTLTVSGREAYLDNRLRVRTWCELARSGMTGQKLIPRAIFST